ncbi:GntP family permease [Stieleria varia]|uniref:Inner membrane permease YgbN n=1 Tax=Stieleria varia TaxID=2528005 RepID=A0A5C6ATP4_9BACT|nr:GntP family permease [Stieleria varia]TWU02382.1 Inner membrane permease YgbN [Stieleria varia]
MSSLRYTFGTFLAQAPPSVSDAVAETEAGVGIGIWWIVALSVAVVLVSILVFRLHAFLTLLLAGLLVAWLSSPTALGEYAQAEFQKGNLSQKQVDALPTTSAATRLATAFGDTAGKIGILIALASIIGQCLLESGAAATIVDRMLSLTGPRRAPEALAASSFLLGIPVFFDTVFYLMVPLARSLRQRLGKDYVLFILAILAGGSLAHSLIPPTPGPLQVAEIIGVDIGVMLGVGLLVGGCSSVISLFAARVINRLVDVPLRFSDDELSDSGLSGSDAQNGDEDSQSLVSLETLPASVPGSANGPSLLASLLPIAVPVVLITVGSVLAYLIKSDRVIASGWTDLFKFTGDKNIAIGIGVLLAFGLMRYVPAEKRKTLVTRSLGAAGSIILITAAGGAFGAMLRQAGIAGAVQDLAQDVPGLLLLPVAFAVTAAVRTLQGSATVAMITAAGVLQGFVAGEGFPFHPVYLAMAIGAGSKPISWMTDSAFWVITRMSGMTEAEGLKVISPMSTAMGFSALAVTMLFAWLVPGVNH